MNDDIKTESTSSSDASARPQSNVNQTVAQAREAGGKIAAAASDVAKDVKDRAVSLSTAAKDQAASALEGQKQEVASGLDEVARAMHRAGEQFEGQQDWIAQVVERGAEELGGLASTLRTNDLQGLIGKLEDLARRQPAVFVGAAMALGFSTVRLGRVVADRVTSEDLPKMPEVTREPV